MNILTLYCENVTTIFRNVTTWTATPCQISLNTSNRQGSTVSFHTTSASGNVKFTLQKGPTTRFDYNGNGPIDHESSFNRASSCVIGDMTHRQDFRQRISLSLFQLSFNHYSFKWLFFVYSTLIYFYTLHQKMYFSILLTIACVWPWPCRTLEQVGLKINERLEWVVT